MLYVHSFNPHHDYMYYFFFFICIISISTLQIRKKPRLRTYNKQIVQSGDQKLYLTPQPVLVTINWNSIFLSILLSRD